MKGRGAFFIYSTVRAQKDAAVSSAALSGQRSRAASVFWAKGDCARVEWSQAVELPGGFYERGSAKPAPRALRLLMAQDGQYLYLRLTESVRHKQACCFARRISLRHMGNFRGRCKKISRIDNLPSAPAALLSH